MDNGAISKAHQETNLQNSNQVAVLRAKGKSNRVENSGKQATQTSDKQQNKFDLPSFKCDLCSYESIWKHAVKRHQQTHYKVQVNSEDIKKAKYKCETCSYTTNNWAVLKDHHRKLHVKKTENGITSDKDLFTLTLTEQKQIRKSKNNEEFNKIDVYRCKKCRYKTNYKVIFEGHQKVHLQNPGEEVFWCDLCTFSSLYRQSFLRHMKTMHENKLTTDNDGDSIEKFKRLEKKKKMAEQSGGNIEIENTTYPQSNNAQVMCENNNVPSHNSDPVIFHEVTTGSSVIIAQKSIAKPRRGKYSDVPVKTTKNGLFECEHCSYQTAIRTALVKHQTNHLKNANS